MRVFFSVGEPSGDQHAAHLISEMRRLRPDLEPCGFGGPLMRAAGCRVHFELTTLAVMGVIKVLPLIWKFYSLVRQAERYFREVRPDAVVLVDFPGFNWWIARRAKKYGIPVYYYLPPQLWAWAPWRVRRVQRYVDHVYSGLNFETEWYRRHHVDVTFVGHPFFDEIAEHPLDKEFVAAQTQRAERIVALLPGSRNEEVQRNFPVMLTAATRLHAEFPDIRFVVANYKQTHLEQCELMQQQTAPGLPVEFHTHRTPEIIESAECVLMVSGSVSLEMLARRKPAVVLYRCGWVMYVMAKMLVTCKYISLPNLMAGRALLPEIGSVGNPAPAVESILTHLRTWLGDPGELAGVRNEMDYLGREVIQVGASRRTAAAIVEQLGELPLRRAA